jgi:DNA-binding MarR family transcriptional regulator
MAEQAEETFHDRLGIPGLLRGARKVYGSVVTAAFAEAGFDDVPRNGAYVLARVYDDSSALAAITRGLGISKQAVSQLIDVMVMRGYIERTPDSADRRRMLLHLTARGEAAAMVARHAVSDADEELLRRIGPDGVSALRAGLNALCQMADEIGGHAGHDHGEQGDAPPDHGEHGDGDHGHGDHGHGEHGHETHRHPHN